MLVQQVKNKAGRMSQERGKAVNMVGSWPLVLGHGSHLRRKGMGTFKLRF